MVFLDKPFHPLGSIVCLPLVFRTFAEAHNARDDAHQIGNPALESGMGEHQVHEGPRERLEGRFVRVRKIVRRHALSLIALDPDQHGGDGYLFRLPVTGEFLRLCDLRWRHALLDNFSIC
jgi:hypothetical protein